MIWGRRIFVSLLIILLIILFIVSFAAILVTMEANNTFANPAFYKNQLQQANIYDFIYEKVIPAALEDLKAALASDFTINVQAISDDTVSAARKAVPPEWLEEQAGTATDTIIPYFLGRRDNFTYTVELRDKVLKASEVVKTDIINGNAFASLYDDGISYAADKVAENLNTLPYSLTFSNEELENSLKEAIPQDWVASQASVAVDTFTSYMVGDSNHFTFTIPLKARVDTAVNILKGLADQKIETKFYSLPICSLTEFNRILQTLPPSSLPPCRPEGISYQEFKNYFNIDTNVASSIRQMVGEKIPNQWSYTDADLMAKLSTDGQQTLNDARDSIKNGYTLTQTDITDRIAQNNVYLSTSNATLHAINTATTWFWAICLISFVFLVFIALLRRRSWIRRAFWALGVLFVASLAIYIAMIYAYPHAVETNLANWPFNPSEYHQQVLTVITEKANEIALNVAAVSGSGIKWMAIYCMIGAGIVLLGLIIWRVVLPRVRRATPQKKSPSV